MGLTTSRPISEPQKLKDFETSIDENVTPKASRVLPFDPRSPTHDVNRTPITVTTTPNGTPSIKSLKTLPLDPRSPTIEITRTPLVVEGEGMGGKFQPTKPLKLSEITFTTPLISPSSKDPRSPTEKVPRTPLEEDNDISNALYTKNENLTSTPKESHDGDSKVTLSKNIEASEDERRRPLADVQNKAATAASGQPKMHLQAMQCKKLEAEFVENEKKIIAELGGNDTQENKLKTNTEFEESI